MATIEELTNLVFRLLEQISLQTGCLKNVDGTFAKVEDHLIKIVEHTDTTANTIRQGILNNRSYIQDLINSSNSLKSSVDDSLKEQPCEVCKEKDKTITTLHEVNKAIASNQKILFIIMLASFIITIISLGFKLEWIAKLVQLVKLFLHI